MGQISLHGKCHSLLCSDTFKNHVSDALKTFSCGSQLIDVLLRHLEEVRP